MSSQRGQRDIFIASSVGILEIWDTHWNNVNALRAQIDVRHGIFQSLGMSHSNEDFSHNLRVLDFIAVPKAPKVSPQGEQAYRQDTALYFLVVLMQGTIPKKAFVIESSLFDESLDVVSTHEVEYQKFVRGLNGPNTRLHIPRPWNMAFIVSSQAIILLSMRKAESSPSAQLLQDVVPKYFQDRIQFRSEGNYEILGSGIEDQTSEMKSSACVIMVKRFGLVRITTSSRQFQEFDFEDTRVTAKQRLEQAIFYGTMSENPLDFDDESNTISSVEELEDAALEICKELLQSKSKFIPSAALSLDQHLRLRAKALNDLGAELLRRRVPLTRRVRWELLWAAEKLASQRTMWKVEEGFRRRWEGSQTFLSRVLNLMNDKFKTKFEPIDAKENDHVRHWFLHDTYRMEHVIPWIFNALRDSKSATSRLGIQFLEQIYQASELSLAILETAFRFREDHAINFGLGEESLDDGVLRSSYAGLPEFWTSQTMVYAETEHLLDLELESCRSWMQQPISKIERSDSSIPNHIAQNSCRQLRTFSKMHHERVRWLSDQTEPRLVDEKSAIEKSHKEQRKWQLFRMAGIGQLQGAITLAEDFRDMEALVELMVELQDQIRDQNVVYEASSSNAQLVCHDMNSFAQRITRYFECFGESWADAFFSRQIIVGQPGMLLSMKEYQQYVTSFLRKSPSYYRLAWINDIVGEDDYHTASHALEYLALEQETNLWDKRVEASLAKLTKLASWERDGRLEQANGLEEIRMLDAVAELGSIQDLVYDHISPALHGAIDRKAELELAMDHFGKYIVSNRPALRELLEDALANVIDRRALGVDQLIDLLTLMDPMHFLEGEESGLLGHEFHLALRILRLSHYADSDPAYYDALQMTIWRRCMIRDNWEGIGKKELRLDADLETHVRNTSLLHTLAECASEGKMTKSISSLKIS
jgi:nuclear pore complex protein Nup133